MTDDVSDKDFGLHEPINAGPEDEDDWRVCGTCGTDLYALFMCPNAPVDECGCPVYLTAAGEHVDGACAVEASAEAEAEAEAGEDGTGDD